MRRCTPCGLRKLTKPRSWRQHLVAQSLRKLGDPTRPQTRDGLPVRTWSPCSHKVLAWGAKCHHDNCGHCNHGGRTRTKITTVLRNALAETLSNRNRLYLFQNFASGTARRRLLRRTRQLGAENAAGGSADFKCTCIFRGPDRFLCNILLQQRLMARNHGAEIAPRRPPDFTTK